MYIEKNHDATRGDLCGCTRCEIIRDACLDVSRANSTIQQSLWHPRNRNLAKAAAEARITIAQAQLAVKMVGG